MKLSIPLPRLRRDFPRLPMLSYGRSLGIVILWGLLFVIVLAMISGARELMTPGAWEKQPNGGYKLSSSDAPPPAPLSPEAIKIREMLDVEAP